MGNSSVALAVALPVGLTVLSLAVFVIMQCVMSRRRNVPPYPPYAGYPQPMMANGMPPPTNTIMMVPVSNDQLMRNPVPAYGNPTTPGLSNSNFTMNAVPPVYNANVEYNVPRMA